MILWFCLTFWIHSVRSEDSCFREDDNCYDCTNRTSNTSHSCYWCPLSRACTSFECSDPQNEPALPDCNCHSVNETEYMLRFNGTLGCQICTAIPYCAWCLHPEKSPAGCLPLNETHDAVGCQYTPFQCVEVNRSFLGLLALLTVFGSLVIFCAVIMTLLLWIRNRQLVSQPPAFTGHRKATSSSYSTKSYVPTSISAGASLHDIQPSILTYEFPVLS